jgi:hypothetical protein
VIDFFKFKSNVRKNQQKRTLELIDSLGILDSINVSANNIKFLIDGGGLNTQQGSIETYTFGTNVGNPTLSICGTSCSTTTSGNTVSLTMVNNVPGAALIQVKSNTPYTQITIAGLGVLQGVNLTICLTTQS